MKILTSKRFAAARKNKDGTLNPQPTRDAVAAMGALAAEQGKDKPLRFVCSDETVDRYNSTIAADGWVLDNFKGNPVMTFNHDADAPVGRWLSMGVEGKQLMGEAEFMPRELSEFGWTIGQMYREGFLRAVSVNFLPIEYKFNDERGFWALDYLKQELIECAAVSMPGNANALIVEGDDEDDSERAFGIAPFEAFAYQSPEYRKLMRGLVERSLAGDPKAPLPKEAATYLRSALGGRPVVQVPVARAEPEPVKPEPAAVVTEPTTPAAPTEAKPDPVETRLAAIETSIKRIADGMATELETEARGHKSHKLSASNLKALNAASKAIAEVKARHYDSEGTDDGEADDAAEEPAASEEKKAPAQRNEPAPAAPVAPVVTPAAPAVDPMAAVKAEVAAARAQRDAARDEAAMATTGKLPRLP